MTDAGSYTVTMTQTVYQPIRVIGLGGKLRSGKDTIADYLVKKHGWIKLGMSDPLKEASIRNNQVIEIKPGEPLNVTGKRIKHLRVSEIIGAVGYDVAKEIADYRAHLQKLGTEVGRQLLGENTWVKVADDMIFERLADGSNVVITGIRFPNELNMINRYDRGELWYVDRPDEEAEGEVAAHASETSLIREDFEVFIENDGTLEELYAKVDKLLLQNNAPLTT